mmetsp:Transcript_12212/g.19284  ORF Transcript_12212/g.19284 Transcript_12212/m.19284 type:complete len:157 (+) Transcript_12212:240-710(+)
MLQTIETEAEMHQLMLDKGFVLKSEEELEQVEAMRTEEIEKEETKNNLIQKKREEKRQRILEEQKEATTNLDIEKRKELKEITLRIKELKKEGGDKDLIKELTKRRTQLARETMISTQANLEKTDAEKARFQKIFRESKGYHRPQQEKSAVGSDEL